MKKYLLFSALLGLAACGNNAPENPADLILTGGYIYTADTEHSIADSIAIRNNRIIAVGSREESLALQGPETIITELDGKMVLPGLHDMHVHGLGLVQPKICDLEGEPYSLAELVPFLETCLEKYAPAPGEWLPVSSWSSFDGNQPDERYPNIREALDAVSTEHPIILWGYDGHHGAANSAALAIPAVPINAETLANEHSGIRSLVETDAEGNPTGGIHEEARQMLRDMDFDFLGVSAESSWLMPQLASKLAQTGITTMHDPAVTEPILEHYLWLADSGDMHFRMRAGLRLDLYDLATGEGTRSPAEAVQGAVTLRERASRYATLQADGVKIFADAVMEGNPYSSPPTLPKAAMIDGFLMPEFSLDDATGALDIAGYVTPKGERTKWHGELVHEPEILDELVSAATTAGFHVHVHTIADASAKATAGAFENAREAAKNRGLTQSIAHLQIARTEDVQRFGELGVYIAFTYLWATPDPAYEMVVVPFIDRIDGVADLYNPDHYYSSNAYPFRTALAAGAIPVFGSDAPVGARDSRPFPNMRAALTRESEGIVLNESETLDVRDVLAAFTINGAKLMGHDDVLGSLEPGKIADLVIVDRNIVELAEAGDYDAIGETKVLTTIFDGEIIYEAESPR